MSAVGTYTPGHFYGGPRDGDIMEIAGEIPQEIPYRGGVYRPNEKASEQLGKLILMWSSMTLTHPLTKGESKS